MNDSSQEPASPCVGVCMMNPDTHLCEGCFRSTEEIESWWDYNAHEKRQVLIRTEERCEKLMDGTFFD